MGLGISCITTSSLQNTTKNFQSPPLAQHTLQASMSDHTYGADQFLSSSFDNGNPSTPQGQIRASAPQQMRVPQNIAYTHQGGWPAQYQQQPMQLMTSPSPDSFQAFNQGGISGAFVCSIHYTMRDLLIGKSFGCRADHWPPGPFLPPPRVLFLKRYTVLKPKQWIETRWRANSEQN